MLADLADRLNAIDFVYRNRYKPLHPFTGVENDKPSISLVRCFNPPSGGEPNDLALVGLPVSTFHVHPVLATDLKVVNIHSEQLYGAKRVVNENPEPTPAIA
jgi:hypothetical protein